MTGVETWVKEMRENHLPHIQNALNDIRVKLDRPSWAVTMIISVLSSICIGMIVASLR